MKRAQGVIFFVIAIAIFASSVFLILFLLYNPDAVREEAPPCSGTCEQFCEENEEAYPSNDCPYMKPICCVDFYQDEKDDPR